MGVRYVVSVDLGQQQDYTAISIIQQQDKFRTAAEVPGHWLTDINDKYITRVYYIRHLERMQESYTRVIGRVEEIVNQVEYAERTALIVDATGVGLAVVDAMRDRMMNPIPIVITSGNSVVENSSGGYNVPKKDLIYSLQVIFESRRIKMPPNLTHIDALQRELKNFRLKVTRSGNDTYSAWREEEHDDLVLSVAQGVWWFARAYRNNKILRANKQEVASDWNPLG